MTHQFVKKFKGTPLGYFIKRFMVFHLCFIQNIGVTQLEQRIYFSLINVIIRIPTVKLKIPGNLFLKFSSLKKKFPEFSISPSGS